MRASLLSVRGCLICSTVEPQHLVYCCEVTHAMRVPTHKALLARLRTVVWRGGRDGGDVGGEVLAGGFYKTTSCEARSTACGNVERGRGGAGGVFRALTHAGVLGTALACASYDACPQP